MKVVSLPYLAMSGRTGNLNIFQVVAHENQCGLLIMPYLPSFLFRIILFFSFHTRSQHIRNSHHPVFMVFLYTATSVPKERIWIYASISVSYEKSISKEKVGIFSFSYKMRKIFLYYKKYSTKHAKLWL